MARRVEKKVAVVTGGARGIGRAACLALAEEGAVVAVVDIIDEEGLQVVEEIRERGGSATYWHLDISKEGEVIRVFGDIRDKFNEVHILVNNAGITGADKPVHEMSEEEWDKVMDVNVKGVFLCTKHALPLMRAAGGGSIVNLSSIYGITGAEDIPAYHASKGAVRLMSKTDALTYAKEGIRVNSVHPGFIWTPLVKAMAEESEEGSEEFRRRVENLHPLGRMGRPEDVAHGIVYLASDEAKFVTGSELVIDGGYTAK